MNGNGGIMKSLSSFKCALTGENDIADPVVTPSGYVCSRKFLLNALLENKGKDPFVTSSEVDLDESQLVDLKQAAEAPLTIPTTSGSSVSSLLTQLQNEYHGVLMELFSTKRSLQQTKQELSTALYQNDAAVRVIARLAMERDEARSQLQQQVTTAPAAAPSKKRARVEDDDNNNTKSDDNKLDDSHIESLVQTWQHLSAGRKAMKKATAVVDYTTLTPDAKNNTMVDCDQLIGAGKGNFWALLSSANNAVTVQPSNISIKLSGSSPPKSVHMMELKPEGENDATWMIATITDDGQLQVYTHDHTDGQISSTEKLSDDVVSVQIHPGGQYLLLTSKDGAVTIVKSSTAETLATFSVVTEANVSCAQLHPDGLIHAMGTNDGKVLLWDVKSQTLASTLEIPQKDATVTSIIFSENGYHLLTCTDANQCIVWDLRKQKMLHTVDDVMMASFDPSGKYTALVQEKQISIASVKDLNNPHKLDCTSCSSMVWTRDVNQVLITTTTSATTKDSKSGVATAWKSDKN